MKSSTYYYISNSVNEDVCFFNFKMPAATEDLVKYISLWYDDVYEEKGIMAGGKLMPGYLYNANQFNRTLMKCMNVVTLFRKDLGFDVDVHLNGLKMTIYH